MATVELTTDNFAQALADNDIVLVDFLAAWCGPCRQFGPIFEQVSEKFPEVAFGKVDTEAQAELARAANITSIPTLMAFRERVLVFSQAGAVGASELTKLVEAVGALDMDEVKAKIAAQQSDQ